MQKEYVVLVNEQDEDLGLMEKIEAHEKALLHRAFSVFIFNSKGQLLLQRRALHKYHSAGLWTNTCCSHPRHLEHTADAAKRRLREEMGMNCELVFKTKFIYKTPFDNGLTEHELDYVYTGISDEEPDISAEEVDSYQWESIENIKQDIQQCPEKYTSWFKIILEKNF